MKAGLLYKQENLSKEMLANNSVNIDGNGMVFFDNKSHGRDDRPMILEGRLMTGKDGLTATSNFSHGSSCDQAVCGPL